MPERVLRLLIEADSNPWLASLFVFVGASFAGLATHLREGKPLERKAVISSVLNSGMFGSIIFLMAWKAYADNVPGLVGLSLLAGIGSASLVSFAVALVKRRMAAVLGVENVQEATDEK